MSYRASLCFRSGAGATGGKGPVILPRRPPAAAAAAMRFTSLPSPRLLSSFSAGQFVRGSSIRNIGAIPALAGNVPGQRAYSTNPSSSNTPASNDNRHSSPAAAANASSGAASVTNTSTTSTGTDNATPTTFTQNARAREAARAMGPEAAAKKNGFNKRRVYLAAGGMVVCAALMYAIAKTQGVMPMTLDEARKKAQQEQHSNKNGSGSGSGNGTIKLDGPTGLATEGKAVLIDGVEQVPTGSDAVPYFPQTIHLPSSLGEKCHLEHHSGDTLSVSNNKDAGKEEEYQLLGLGVRTVTFFSIKVYVVGMYVATRDIPLLQQRLLKQAQAGPKPDRGVGGGGDGGGASSLATSLLPFERDALKQSLLEPSEKGEEVWNEVLRHGGVKTAIRIVPTRNTDFGHLRDAWVRTATNRAKRAQARVSSAAAATAPDSPSPDSGDAAGTQMSHIPFAEYADPNFGASVNDLKAMTGTGKKSLPKNQIVYLLRGRLGTLELLVQPPTTPANRAADLTWIGGVADERIGRVLWQQYLAGKTVASEEARRSIIEGMMEFMARPTGTL